MITLITSIRTPTHAKILSVPEEHFGRSRRWPYYTILQLPGYEEPEFVLILPFTPSNRTI